MSPGHGAFEDQGQRAPGASVLADDPPREELQEPRHRRRPRVDDRARDRSAQDGALLPPSTCCHTFRSPGITAYLSNGGTLEHAQQIAGHASPKMTKLYDRTADTVAVEEIERIVI